MPSSACKTCARSEEHTSELQSHDNLVCRLLLEKKHHDPCPSTLSRHRAPGAWRAPPAAHTHRPAAGDVRVPRAGRAGVIEPGSTVFFFNVRAAPKFSPLPLPKALRF